MSIHPHETKMIGTGIASAFSDDYVLMIKERGSTGTKGMGVRAGIVDSGFRDEIRVVITNHNDRNLLIIKEEYIDEIKGFYSNAIIYPYEKAIAQALLLPVPKVEAEELDYDDLTQIKSKRGLGMLGSSGK